MSHLRTDVHIRSIFICILVLYENCDLYSASCIAWTSVANLFVVTSSWEDSQTKHLFRNFVFTVNTLTFCASNVYKGWGV